MQFTTTDLAGVIIAAVFSLLTGFVRYAILRPDKKF